MPVELDPGTGRVRLDQTAMDALVAARRDGSARRPGEDVEDGVAALWEAGVLGEEGVHTSVAPGLDTLLDPWCELSVVVTGGAGAQRHQCWVAPEAAGMLLQLPDGWWEFATLPPNFVPVTVARVVRLGPRPAAPSEHTEQPEQPRQAEPFELPTALVRELLAEQEGVRRSAAVQLVGALPEAAAGWVDAASEGAWRAWQVEARWQDPAGETAGRALTVLDSPAGMLAVAVPEEETEQVSVVPVSPSVMWRQLTLMLPGDDEMADRPDG